MWECGNCFQVLTSSVNLRINLNVKFYPGNRLPPYIFGYGKSKVSTHSRLVHTPG